MFNSFSYSALAAACFSSSVMGLRVASCFSCSRTRSASWRSRSIARRSSMRGTSASSRCESPGGERRRLGEGDREGGERFRAPAVGEKVPGGGVGTRTADCRTTGSDMARSQSHRKRQMRGRGVGKKHRMRGGEVLQLAGVAKESSGRGHVSKDEPPGIVFCQQNNLSSWG